MSIDFNKPPKIIVVHGVQLGSDADVDGAKKIQQLVTNSLQDPTSCPFDVEGYYYEDINDRAQKFYQLIAQAISLSKPLIGEALQAVIDIVGDVVTSAENTSTAHLIKKGLKDKILAAYQQQRPVYLISHSLGTVYTLQVLNELMTDELYFNEDDCSDWPAMGLLTMGSPLGLDMQLSAINVFPYYQPVSLSHLNFQRFNWQNYFNRLDPVVSGHIFGSPVDVDGSEGPVEHRYSTDCANAKWQLNGNVITQGEQWLLAHISYWDSPVIGDEIVNQLWG